MTPPILARVAQLHGSSDETDCNTITTTTSWEYVSKSSSLSDLTKLGTAFLSSPSPSNFGKQDIDGPSPSSSVLSTSKNPLGRSLLPLGIVPLPPPHRHAHNNGFHNNHLPHQGYRLTQKDLLQPASVDDVVAPPIRSGSEVRNDSNPVMRSTSFNLDYGAAAAKRQNLKYRQASNANRPSRHSQSQLSSSGRPRQQAIVLVAENPESGQSDVYNVPFQSDIYSLPVDSILSGNNDLNKSKSSSKSVGLKTSCTSISQTNLNQRFQSETVTSNNAVTPPPPRKHNLSRRTSCGGDIAASNEHGTKGIDNLSSHSRDLQSGSHSQHEPRQSAPTQVDEPCKPPQRSTSLSVQPSSIKEIPTTTAPIIPPPIPISNHRSKQISTEPVLHPTTSMEFKPIPPVRTSASSSMATNSVTGSKCSNHGSKVSDMPAHGMTDSTGLPVMVKKPRSRSVDPASELDRDCFARSSVKRSVEVTYTSNNYFDTSNSHQLGDSDSTALPTADLEHSLSIFPGGSNGRDHGSTVDRRNPLGISLLNLFRRHKGSPTTNTNGTGKQTNHFHQSKTDSDDSRTPLPSNNHNHNGNINSGTSSINNNKEDTSYYFRELPPPPPGQHSDSSSDEQTFSPVTSPMECRDFAASIEKVKDCGWYWGPLSSEAAEDLLKNEPDGSFIVRDSSDARYIFSLTFKLHGLVRHVRIEHDQGNFSFGPLTRFKAATIVDFVEKAVAHSRSGRYLFFLHRRPVLGPMQVQLLHPYSRFMHPRSLKHMCRFVILKYVRRDLIHTLPLPKPMQDYLNTPHYYFEPSQRSGSNASTSHHQSALA